MIRPTRSVFPISSEKLASKVQQTVYNTVSFYFFVRRAQRSTKQIGSLVNVPQQREVAASPVDEVPLAQAAPLVSLHPQDCREAAVPTAPCVQCGRIGPSDANRPTRSLLDSARCRWWRSAHPRRFDHGWARLLLRPHIETGTPAVHSASLADAQRQSG